jgi:hypothetical protein
MLLNRFIIISAVLGLLTILLTLRAVRRGWRRESERIRRRLECGRILRRAERIPARVAQQVMGNTAGADLTVALVLTETELHVFRHVAGDLARAASGAPFHALLAPSARAGARPDRRGLALTLADAPVRDGATVELRLANPAPVSWRLTFPDEADATEWFALIDQIARAETIHPPEIRGR